MKTPGEAVLSAGMAVWAFPYKMLIKYFDFPDHSELALMGYAFCGLITIPISVPLMILGFLMVGAFSNVK